MTFRSTAASLIFAEIVSHPTVKPQTEARARVALDLSRQKRGPPAETFSSDRPAPDLLSLLRVKAVALPFLPIEVPESSAF